MNIFTNPHGSAMWMKGKTERKKNIFFITLKILFLESCFIIRNQKEKQFFPFAFVGIFLETKCPIYGNLHKLAAIPRTKKSWQKKPAKKWLINMNCSEILPYGRHFWLNGCYYYSCRWKKASHQRGTHTHAHHKWKTIERSHVTRMKTKLILFNINTATNRRHSQQQRTERSWERKKAHLKWIHPIFSYYSSETHVTCMCERDGVVRFFLFACDKVPF